MRYYIATINYAIVTGELRQLRSLGARNCVSCRAISRNIGRIYAAGGHISSLGWRLQGLRIVEVDESETVLSLDVTLSPETVVKREAAEPEHHAGARQPMTAFLERSQGEWLVSRLDLVT